MLYTKFRGNRPIGSGDEAFQRVFTIYERGGSWSCDQDPVDKFSFYLPMEALHIIST